MCILCSQPDAPGDGTADWPVARQQIYCFGGFTNTPADPASPDVISAKHAAGYGSVYLVGSVFFICVSASELQGKYSHCGKTKESYLNLSLLIFLSASSFFFLNLVLNSLLYFGEASLKSLTEVTRRTVPLVIWFMSMRLFESLWETWSGRLWNKSSLLRKPRISPLSAFRLFHFFGKSSPSSTFSSCSASLR